MFERWGRTVARARWLVIGLAAAFVAIGAVWGTGVFGALVNGGFEDPGSESALAAQRAEAELGRQDADVLAVYTGGDVDDPAFRAAVERSLGSLPPADVTSVATFWSTDDPALVSEDGRSTIAVLRLEGADRGARMETFRELEDDLRASPAPGVEVRLGGVAAVNDAVNGQITEDLARAELISLPLLLVLLVLVFGSLVAASLPLGVGVVAVLGAFTALRALTGITDVSVFAVNLVTLIGLGLAIDYSLFVVSRFREELRAGRDVPGALAVTMATAGRTVVFSGVTVAVSLAGLALFPQVFLRSMAYGGVAAVLVAMIAAVTVLPAILAVLGPRVDAWSPLRRFRRADRPERAGGWERVARSVMRRPVLYAVAATAVLLALAAPFLRVQFGGIDSRVLPAGSEVRQVDDLLRDGFPALAADPVDVLVEAPDVAAAEQARERLAAVPGAGPVRVVATDEGDPGRVLLAVAHPAAAMDDRTLDLVGDLRAADLPAGTTALVGGSSAEQVDLRASLAERLPWAGGVVLLATFLLLFLAFGSVVLPVKAVLMNALSMTASFGVVVWIFQDGNLSGLLGFTPTGTIETTQPILMLGILFGLSMDYEVFLLSRIREHHARTGDTTDAVAVGLQRSGRIITSAALLLVVVIGAFSTSGVTFIKMIGIGMAVAIIVDATLVRALLVPATMRLLGDLNWWAPGPMRRWWERHGIPEAADPVPAALPETPVDRPVPVT